MLVADGPSTVVVETPVVEVTAISHCSGQSVVCATGGADIEVLRFDVELWRMGDADVRLRLGGDGDEADQRSLSWALSPGEAQSVLLRVFSGGNDLYQWRARIPLIADGVRRWIDVPAGDELPHQLAGSGVGEQERLNSENGRWVPLDRPATGPR